MELKKSVNGQALVEWAIIFPAMLIMTFGVCQWCLIQLNQTLVNHAAWQAARAQLVWESPFDAAAISLLPVAGWSSTLRASLETEGGYQSISNVSESDLLSLPGWSPFTRSSFIEDRLKVTVLDDNWKQSTCEVIFRSELLFPFVDVFFAQSEKQANQVVMKSESVSSDVTSGFAFQSSDFKDTFSFKAKNFIDLKARSSAARIDHPRNHQARGLEFGDWIGGPEFDTETLLFIQPNSPPEWKEDK